SLEASIGEFGVGDGSFAKQVRRLRPLLRQFLQLAVHSRIDATDEEAGNRRDPVDRVSFGCSAFEPAYISFGDLLVYLHSEYQRNVDVDAGGSEFFNCRKSLRSGRDFDHYVWPINASKKRLRFGNSCGSVVREQGRDFQADKTVASTGLVVDRPEHIKRRHNVLDDDFFVDLVYTRALCGKRAHFVVVLSAAADGFFKDGGIRRDTAQAILLDQALQL